MNVLKLAAFSQNGQGGNPAGVPSRLSVQYGSKLGESVAVSGEVRYIEDKE